jgi:hypothetical protein
MSPKDVTIKKILKFTPRIRTQGLCNSCSILTLDHQCQIHLVPTKLLMLRSQLREQICQTSKVTGKNESLVVLNGTNIDMWEHIASALMVQ